MISKNKKLGGFICTLTAFICDMVFFGKPISADEAYKSCGVVKVLAIHTTTPHTLSNPTEPKIVVTNSTQYKAERNKKKSILIAIGPSFTSADSFEINNSALTCTNRGFNIVTKVTRSAAFNGSLDRNIPWQPRSEVTFTYPENRSIIVNSTWKMVSETGVEVDRDISNPRQIFPLTVRKVIR